MSSIETRDERLQQAMKLVLLATLPGWLALFWFYGWGVLINLILSVVTALGVEAAVTYLRRQPLQSTLSDGSAVVSATLLAIALPPYCPWWLTVTAIARACCWANICTVAWAETLSIRPCSALPWPW